MSRERAFSKPEVLDRLTDAFVTHGYASTSLALLQEATGLGKQSLYNAFGDKQAMYLQAIDCAVQRGTQAVATMRAAPDGRAALSTYFEAVLRTCVSGDAAQQNCIVTSGLLAGLDEPSLSWALTGRWHATHELLRAEVERGQRDGSIVNPMPSAELAELLVSLISGLRVGRQAGRGETPLRRLVELTLSILDRP